VCYKLPEKTGATNLKSKFNSQDAMSFTNKPGETNDLFFPSAAAHD
jgi:hypothetical protein